MPKVKQLKMSREAIRARERREGEREEQKYNTTLKEFIQYRYSEIIDEFNPFYEELKTKYPEKRVYTNTNEFRLWRKKEIQKTFSNDGVEVVSFDSVDLNGKDSDEQQDEQQDEQEQQPGEQQHHEDNILAVAMEQADDEITRVIREIQNGDIEQQQQHEDNSNDNNNLAAAVEQAGNEIERILQEIQNGDIPLSTEDEGIALDIYEEIQGDIEEFNYGLEIELNNW